MVVGSVGYVCDGTVAEGITVALKFQLSFKTKLITCECSEEEDS